MSRHPERRSTRTERQRGFAVMEALVALAILAAALTLIYRTMGAGWNAVRQTGIEAKAVSVAMARMETVGSEAPLAEGSTQGSDDGIDWRIDISLHTMPGMAAIRAQVPAWWVKVEATWQERLGEAPRSVALTSLKVASTPP